MKRYARNIVLFVLAGAIVNFAVAWACALKSPLALNGDYAIAEPDGTLRVRVMSGRGAVVIWGVRSKGAEFISPLDPTYPLPRILDELGAPTMAYRNELAWMEHRSMQAYGWPFLSLASIGGSEILLKNDQWQREPSRWGIADSRIIRQERNGPTWTVELPLLPERGGFAANTFVFACGLWLVGTAPWMSYRRLMRRRYREKHGLCGACAYPVGVSDVCTECGKPVTPKRAEAFA